MSRLQTRLWLVPFFLLSILLVPVSGNRFLWQDEIETAERARSILSSGLPKTVDPEGRVSLNAGGREIEEGTLHRYTPWGQFYIGAGGLAVARLVGANHDAGLRTPFILLHAGTSTVLAYGLMTICAWPAAAAIGATTLWGLGTVRLLHNRTARYHAALDFLFALGLVSIGMLKARPRSRSWLLALGAATFLLPQMHTLGGGLLSSTLVLLAILVFSNGELAKLRAAIRTLLPWAVVPALSSVLLICMLCRPWAQGAWAHGAPPPFSSLKSSTEVAFGFYIFAAGLLLLASKKRFRELVILLVVAAYIVLIVRVLDFHPFSQTRYYLSVPLFLVFGFLAFGIRYEDKIRNRIFISLVFIAALLPDLQGVFPAAQGLRIVASDYTTVRAELQPVGEALKIIRETSANEGTYQPVLIDYVPQYVNWYLPQSPVALMPDLTNKSALNEANLVWKATLQYPGWHLRYASQNGLWTCAHSCDFHASEIVDQRYKLSSQVLGRVEEMCVIKRWPTTRVNNAPFIEYYADAKTPEGVRDDTFVLARRCAKAP